MRPRAIPSAGFLYVGLMLTADGPKVVEFNVRFGDPEAQVVLPMLDEDLSWLLWRRPPATLPSRAARFRDEPHVGVVLASAGYPEASESGKPSPGSTRPPRVPGALVFHAGTAGRDGQIVTAGGRVLTVVGRGPVLSARPSTWPTGRRRRSGSTACSSAATSAARRWRPWRSVAMRYAVVTFGCRVNQADSLEIEGELRARRGEPPRPTTPTSSIVNTCSVTAAADQGARQTIRRIARDNPSARIVVTGCYATRRPDESRALPERGARCPNPDKDDLVRDLARRRADDRGAVRGRRRPLRRRARARRCGAHGVHACACRPAATSAAATASSRRRAARPIAAAGRGARATSTRAIEAGYKEIAMTGVHLGSYGRDLGDGTSLMRSSARWRAWPDDVLFRISSLEPMDCSRSRRLVAGSPRLAPHFHLPLQHALRRDARAPCGGPIRSAYYRDARRRASATGCRTRRSAPT